MSDSFYIGLMSATTILSIFILVVEKMHFVRSSPGVDFTKILRAAFSYESLLSSFLYLRLRFVFFWRKEIGVKAAHRMLVKLTTVLSIFWPLMLITSLPSFKIDIEQMIADDFTLKRLLLVGEWFLFQRFNDMTLSQCFSTFWAPSPG